MGEVEAGGRVVEPEGVGGGGADYAFAVGGGGHGVVFGGGGGGGVGGLGGRQCSWVSGKRGISGERAEKWADEKEVASKETAEC